MTNRAYQLGHAGSFRAAAGAYAAAANALASCPAADRTAHIDAYVAASRAVIAGAALAANGPRAASDEAALVARAESLRALVDLRAASSARMRAVREADGWVRTTASTLPRGASAPSRRHH